MSSTRLTSIDERLAQYDQAQQERRFILLNAHSPTSFRSGNAQLSLEDIPTQPDTSSGPPPIPIDPALDAATISLGPLSLADTTEQYQAAYFELVKITAHFRQCLDTAIAVVVKSDTSDKELQHCHQMNAIEQVREPFRKQQTAVNKKIEELVGKEQWEKEKKDHEDPKMLTEVAMAEKSWDKKVREAESGCSLGKVQEGLAVRVIDVEQDAKNDMKQFKDLVEGLVANYKRREMVKNEDLLHF